jgi:hypothetical protein
MGKNEQIKIMRMGNISPMPTQIMRSGSHPRAGMGYKRLNTGCKVRFMVSFHPITTPMAIPAREPAQKPIRTRIALLKR